MNYEYIETRAALDRAVARLAAAPILGVDTEAAGYHRYHDRISLVQISTRDENVLIDPVALADLSALGPLFQNPAVEKIFHDADFDLRILYRDLGLEVRSLFDTQIAAAFLGERLLGLGAIVEKFLGLSLPKEFQRADWAERPLTQGMKEYAATDTAHLPDLRDRLLEELTKIGRLGWAQEEFIRREGTRWEANEGANDAFLKIKGSRDLSPRGLGILRELHNWRESVGQERDQATFRILSNQSMIEIAMKTPTSTGALKGIPGVPSGLVDRRGHDIVAAVERGLGIPESGLPRFPPARRWERDQAVEERADKLRQLRNRLADDLNLDAGFLISRAVLDEIARKNPKTREDLSAIPEVRNWQIEAVGDDILRSMRS